MITSHNHKGRIRKSIDGIDVVYLPVSYDNSMSFFRRGIAFIKFMIWAMVESLLHRQVDFCYVMTTPLSTGIIALFNKYILLRPYVFEVGDLWPKVPFDMGLIKAKWKQTLLIFFEKICYRKAKGLVGLSNPITEHLQLIAPEIPAQTVFNISDCEHFSPAPKRTDWLDKYDIKDQLVISYTGTFGLANDLSQLIDFAMVVEGLPIRFLMVGDGAEKQQFLKLVERRGLTNIQVYPSMSKTQILEVVNVSDAMLVSFAPVDSLHTGSPNKFFDALAAGKLVVSNFRGWLGDLIEKECCGLVAESPDQFKQKILAFIDDAELLKTYQANARKLAKQKFDLKIQSKRQQEFIQQLFSSSRF